MKNIREDVSTGVKATIEAKANLLRELAPEPAYFNAFKTEFGKLRQIMASFTRCANRNVRQMAQVGARVDVPTTMQGPLRMQDEQSRAEGQTGHGAVRAPAVAQSPKSEPPVYRREVVELPEWVVDTEPAEPAYPGPLSLVRQVHSKDDAARMRHVAKLIAQGKLSEEDALAYLAKTEPAQPSPAYNLSMQAQESLVPSAPPQEAPDREMQIQQMMEHFGWSRDQAERVAVVRRRRRMMTQTRDSGYRNNAERRAARFDRHNATVNDIRE